MVSTAVIFGGVLLPPSGDQRAIATASPPCHADGERDAAMTAATDPDAVVPDRPGRGGRPMPAADGGRLCALRPSTWRTSSNAPGHWTPPIGRPGGRSSSARPA